MPQYSRQTEIQEKVDTWLQEQGVDYIREARYDLLGITVDFLVLRPQPVVFEVMDVPAGGQVARQKRIEILIQRIALGDEFGPYVPYVLVLPPHDGREDDVYNSSSEPGRFHFPLVDGVLTVDALPDWETLPDYIRFDQQAQEVIENAPISDVSPTDEEEIYDLWSKSMSLEYILRAESLPSKTLARQLQSRMHMDLIGSEDERTDQLALHNEPGAEVNNPSLRDEDFGLETVTAETAEYVIGKMGGQLLREQEHFPRDSNSPYDST